MDPHKFVQQALAAHMAGATVHLSRYSSRLSEEEEELRKATAEALNAMEGKTPREIWSALTVPTGTESGAYNPDFVRVFCGKLSSPAAYEQCW